MAFASDPASLSFHLKELGFADVAEHLTDLAGVDDNNDSIPMFSPPPLTGPASSLDPQVADLYRLTIEKQRSEFRRKMITDADCEIIKRIMADKETLDVNLVRFRLLEKELGKEKFDLLFNDEMKSYFVFKDTFQCSTFVQFVLILSQVQLAVMYLYFLDNRITDFVHEYVVQDMIKYYAKNVNELEQLNEESLEWYLEYYAPIVVSRMRFFINGTWNGKFNLVKLITSKSFVQFVFMDGMDATDNPFSVKNTSWIYSLYVKMDSQKEGMLTKDDMRVLDAAWGKFEFSDAFLNRLFEKLHTFDGKLDFQLFLTVVWPLRYIGEPQAAHFFVNIFDLDGDGRVGILDLRYFYKSIYEKKEDQEKVTFDWFMSEIYDMCQCREEGFTAEMLIESGEQEHIIKMMIDMGTVNGEDEEDPFGDDSDSSDEEDDDD